MFGVDWDGDGEESLFDDFITMDLIEEDITDNKTGEDKPTGSCLSGIIGFGFLGMVFFAGIIILLVSC